MSGLAGLQTQGERTVLSLLHRPFLQEVEASWNKHLRLAFARSGSTAVKLPIKFMCAIWISNCNILAFSASDFICLSAPFLRQRQFACNVFSMKTENGMMRCGNKTIFRLMPFLQKRNSFFVEDSVRSFRTATRLSFLQGRNWTSDKNFQSKLLRCG